MKIISRLFVLFIFLTSSINVASQNYTIETDILISPPYPITLDSYLDLLETGVVQVTNNESANQTAYFSFSLFETSGKLAINPTSILNDPITIEPGINIFSPDQIESLFSSLTADDIIISGLTPEEQNAFLLSGQLPEGEYKICLQAFNINGMPISNPSQGCSFFDVIYGERPVIINPYNGEDFAIEFHYFHWAHNVNDISIGARFEYTVKIIDLTAEAVDNVNLAMVNPNVPSIYEETFAYQFFLFLFSPIDVVFEEGHDYAVRVSVSDPFGEVPFQFGGHSEIVQFTFKKEYGSDIIDAPQILSEAQLNFEEESPVIIEWEHTSADLASGDISYEAILVDVAGNDLEDIEIDQLLELDPVWQSDDPSFIIEISPEEVEWVPDNTYAMVIIASSSDESDQFNNDGISEIYNFILATGIDDAGGDDEGGDDEELPAAEIIFPVNNLSSQIAEIKPVITKTAPVAPATDSTETTTYQVNLKWDHDLDPSEDSITILTSEYTLQVIDLTLEAVGTLDISDFTNTNVKKIYNAPLDKTSKSSSIIKPAGTKKFLPGHTYAMTILVADTTETATFSNEGYSDFIKFSFPDNTVLEPGTQLPEISYPIDHSNINDDNIVRLDWDHDVPDSIHLVTTYKCQIIDLTDRGINEVESKHFVWAGAKIYDGEIQRKDDVHYINISSASNTIEPKNLLIKDHEYAIAIKATSSSLDTANYDNDGYSNIRSWTYSDQLPVPYIITPENPTINLNANLDFKWDHVLDNVQQSNIDAASVTTYRLKIMDLEQLVSNTPGQTTTIQPTIENFNSTEIEKIYNDTISAKQLSLIPNIAFIKSHKYAIVLQAISSANSVVYPNGGFSEIVLYTHDEVDADGCPKSNCETVITNMVGAVVDSTYKTQIYQMGDLDFKIKTITSGEMGTSGPFSGTGTITVPFMANIKVGVSFTDIEINSAKQVVSGSAIGQEDKKIAAFSKIAEMGTVKAGIDQTAAASFAAALQSGKQLTSVLRGKAVKLPIGFDQEGGVGDITVGITEMIFTPTVNELTAVVALNIPDWQQQIPSFAADKVCFKSSGFGPNVRLSLYDDFSVESAMGQIILKKTDVSDNSPQGTYVECNCNGFKSAQITADFPVSRDILTPVDDLGDVIEDTEEQVIVSLSGRVEKEANFLLSASISPCEIPGLEGFSLAIEDGFLDLSEKSNPLAGGEAINFPNGYPIEEIGNNWKGVWFKSIKLTAPRDFLGGSETARTSVRIENFIMDEAGVSLVGTVDSLLSIEKGSIEGFAISIDKFEVDIIRNQFNSVRIDGQMGMPLLPVGQYLKYDGFIDREKQLADAKAAKDSGQTIPKTQASFTFSVNDNDLNYFIPSLKSSMSFEGSQILLKSDHKEKGVRLALNGFFNLGDQEGDEESMFDFPVLGYEGFVMDNIKSVTPVLNPNGTTKVQTMEIEPGVFTLNGVEIAPGAVYSSDDDQQGGDANVDADDEAAEPKVNKFPLKLTELAMEALGDESNPNGVRIKVGGALAIVRPPKASGQKGFELSADANLSVKADLNKDLKNFSFKFKEIEKFTLNVESQVGVIGVKGRIEFVNNDPIFGSGVAGKLDVTAPLVNVGLDARFGVKKRGNGIGNYKYFYLFGNADFPGYPIGQSGIFFRRINGGFYSNMTIVDPDANDPGNRYAPDEDILFGVKAGIGFSYTKQEQVAFATAGLEFNMNKNGGLNQFTCMADLYMLHSDPMNITDDSEVEGIEFNSEITYKPGNEIGSFDLSLDFTAKLNLVDGLFIGNQSGKPQYTIVDGGMSFNGSVFDMEFGRIDQPGSVELKMPGANEEDDESSGDGLHAKATGEFYLQASFGKTPEFTPFEVPDFIATLLGKTKDFERKGGDPEVVHPNVYDESFAIAAGLDLTFDAGIKYAMLYANFKAQLGFDASITGNSSVACTNTEDGSFGIGDSQHYAEAQVYAGLDGSIGLDVDCFLYTGKVELAALKAALLLQGGFPNPIYANGAAMMKFNVLGGLVSGDINFDVKLGKKCEPDLSYPLAGIEFIEGIDPNSKGNISPFIKPMVSFSNHIGNYDLNDQQGNPLEFDVELEKFELLIGDQVVANLANARIAWDNLSAYLSPSVALSPNTLYTVNVELQVYEIVGNTRTPKTTQSKSTTFMTGTMPDYVPWENVTDCYPFKDEEFYMVDNNVSDQGLIKLGLSQASLFEPYAPADQQWHNKVVAEVSKSDREYLNSYSYYNVWNILGISDVSYDNATNIIHYDFPNKSLLAPSSKYKVTIKRSWYQNPNFDQNGEGLEDVMVSNYNTEITYKKEGKRYTNAPEGKPADKNLATYIFESSAYRKFSDKIGSSNINKSVSSLIHNTPWYVYKFENGEKISEQEIGARIAPDGRTVNKNCAFIQEDITRLSGTFFAKKYYEIQNMMLYLAYEHDITGVDYINEQHIDFYTKYNLAFVNVGEGVVFDFDDAKARSLYSSSNTQNAHILSDVYLKFPIEKDYVHFDYMMFKLVGQKSGSKYEDAFWASDRKLYNEYNSFWENQMGAGVNRGWGWYANSWDGWSNNKRQTDYKNYIKKQSYYSNPTTKLYYTYTIPYFDGTFQYLKVEESSFVFAKPFQQ